MYLCFFPDDILFPLYLALYDFLGNNTIWSSLDLKGKKASTGNPNKGVNYDNSTSQGFVNPVSPLLDQAKVALIIGPETASVGEIVAQAFKERPNTLFVGEQFYNIAKSSIKRLIRKYRIERYICRHYITHITKTRVANIKGIGRRKEFGRSMVFHFSGFQQRGVGKEKGLKF